MLCLLKSFQVVSTAVTVTGVALQTRGGQSSSVQSPFGPGVELRRLVVCDHQTCHIIDVERRQCEQARVPNQKNPLHFAPVWAINIR